LFAEKGFSLRYLGLASQHDCYNSGKKESGSEYAGADGRGDDITLVTDGSAQSAVRLAADSVSCNGGIARFSGIQDAISAQAASAVRVAARELSRNAKVALLAGIDEAVAAGAACAVGGAARLLSSNGGVALLAGVELAVAAEAVGVVGSARAGHAPIALGVPAIEGGVERDAKSAVSQGQVLALARGRRAGAGSPADGRWRALQGSASDHAGSPRARFSGARIVVGAGLSVVRSGSADASAGCAELACQLLAHKGRRERR